MWQRKIYSYATALVLGFSSVLLYSYCSWEQVRAPGLLPSSTPTDFNWENLEPNDKLDWVDCYDGFQCARFKVPLDYSHPEDGNSAAIALIRIPSPSTCSLDYRGPVIVNPGGPGGDGIDFMRLFGKDLSTIVGPHFDLVSFAPRGLGHTTPRVTFFNTDTERTSWAPWAFPDINASADAIPNIWAHAQILGRLAQERDDGAAKHVTTDVVARDMLQITQAHGRDKIQFWGLSYGTVLGATFAAMFPDHVERLIFDGVVDAEDYFAIRWESALSDTDKVMDIFFSECASAGPEGCLFHAPTAQAVSERLSALYESIRARPVAVYTPTSYGIVDYSLLRQVIFFSLYSPYALFPQLAKALAELEAGNGVPLFEMSAPRHFNYQCDEKPQPFGDNAFEAQTAILCSDAEEIHESPEELNAYYDKLVKISSFAEIIGSIRMRCSGWRIRGGDHFTGPFVGNTSHPILLIGNTADPVTPLKSAHKMSQGFLESVVLTQASSGHCSLSGISNCTLKYVRQYLENGTLPDPGTVCSVDVLPFFSGSNARWDAIDDLNQSDRELLQAAQRISRSFRPSVFGIY